MNLIQDFKLFKNKKPVVEPEFTSGKTTRHQSKFYQSSLKLEQNPALVYQETTQRGDADISARKNYTENPKDSDIPKLLETRTKFCFGISGDPATRGRRHFGEKKIIPEIQRIFGISQLKIVLARTKQITSLAFLRFSSLAQEFRVAPVVITSSINKIFLPETSFR